jgi:hypothetical protein
MQVYAIGVGQAGDFSVLVQANGYAPWSQYFHADANACGQPNSNIATARLQRLTP